MNCLSHIISAYGIHPHTLRVDAIRDFPVPTDKKALHQFVGLITSYKRFVPHCAYILQPLCQVLSANSFSWDQHAQKAFQGADQTLSEAVMLVHPRVGSWDQHAQKTFERAEQTLSEAVMLVHSRSISPTCVTTDACPRTRTLGLYSNSLSRVNGNPVELFSRKLNSAEFNCTVPLALSYGQHISRPPLSVLSRGSSLVHQR